MFIGTDATTGVAGRGMDVAKEIVQAALADEVVEFVGTIALGIEYPYKGAHASAGDICGANASLVEGLQHADMGITQRATSRKYQRYAGLRCCLGRLSLLRKKRRKKEQKKDEKCVFFVVKVHKKEQKMIIL